MSKKYLIDKIRISLYNLFTVSKRTKTLMMVSFDIVVFYYHFISPYVQDLEFGILNSIT